MTKPKSCPRAPGPLEGYAARFDDLFTHVAQRRGMREYLALAPQEPHRSGSWRRRHANPTDETALCDTQWSCCQRGATILKTVFMQVRRADVSYRAGMFWA